MTSVPHEAARQMVRDCPDLVLELLRRGQGVVLPEPESIVLEEADLSQVLPAELRSDVVVEMLEHGGGRTGLIVEVQLARDQDKLYSWPSYAAALHARMRAQVCLVVLTFDRDVALWAARPILTLQLGSRFQPLVLGPEQIPLVVDPRQAADMPQLAMLSALCHGEGDEGAAVLEATVLGLEALEPQRRELYGDILLASLGEVARNALEAMMNSRITPVVGSFAHKYIELGKAEGWTEGKAEGWTEGKAKGRTEGKTEGKAEGLLLVLEARGWAVDEAARVRILQCQDQPTLDRWLTRAVSATSLAEVLASG